MTVIKFMPQQEVDIIIKRLMTCLGTPDSLSLYQAFKQLQNEIVQGTTYSSRDEGIRGAVQLNNEVHIDFITETAAKKFMENVKTIFD